MRTPAAWIGIACVATVSGCAALTPELGLQTAHLGNANAIAYAPDGRTLATGGDAGEVKIWEAGSGTLLRTMQSPTIIRITRLAWVGREIYAAGEDGVIRKWAPASGRVTDSIVLPGPGAVLDLAAAGHTVAGLTEQFDGSAIFTWRKKKGAWQQDSLPLNVAEAGLALLGGGDNLILSSADNALLLWSLTQRRVLRTIPLPDRPVRLKLNSSGRMLGVSFPDRRIVLYSTDTWAVRGTVGPVRREPRFAIAPDGTELVAGDDSVWRFDTRSGTETGHLEQVIAGSLDLVWSPDGNVVAATAVPFDNSPAAIGFTWSRDGRFLRSLPGMVRLAADLVLAPGDTIAYSISDDNIVLRWRLGPARVAAEPMLRHRTRALSLAISPDGRMLAVGGGDFGQTATLDVWDLITGGKVAELDEQRFPIRSLAFTPSGDKLIAASEDGTTRVWDAHSWSQLLSVAAVAPLPLRSISISPDGTRLATGGYDQTARIWDLVTGVLQLAIPPPPHVSGISSLAFDPTGAWLVIGRTTSNQIEVRSAVTGDLRALVKTDNPNVVAWSPDGAVLAVASGSGWISLFDPLTGGLLRRAQRHELEAQRVSFTRDGLRMLSVGNDATLRMADVRTGQWLAAVYAGAVPAQGALPVGEAEFVAITPSGHFTASPLGERNIRLRAGLSLRPAFKFHRAHFRPAAVAAALAPGRTSGVIPSP